jgi:hypothetical protein
LIYGNLEVIKYIIEQNKFNLNDKPLINSIYIKSDFKQNKARNDPSKELEENYLNFNVPCQILAAISGNVELFKLVAEKVTDIQALGHCFLTKKKMNSLWTNAIGAACYFTNFDIVKYILDNNVGINLMTISKGFKRQK